MKFYKNALITASVILLIVLAIIAGLLAFDKDKVAYPPVVSECPDYWVDVAYLNSKNGKKYLNDKEIYNAVKQSNSDTECVNFKKLGTCMDNLTIDPNNPTLFPGGEGVYNGSKMCAQFQWASGCDLTWDGITNRENICSFPK